MTVIRHTNEAKQKISEGVKRYIREHGPYRVNSKHSEMAKRKISEGLLRFFHNNAYARHTLSMNNGTHRPEVRKKMSESNKRRLVNPLLPFVFKKGHHFLEDIELRRIKNVMKGLRKRPTLLEHDMLRIIQKHNLPFRYVGDGEIWLGHSNPDFIHIDKGKKICLEVSNTFNRNYESYAKPRIEKLQLVGWRCLVFFGEKNQLNEDDILCSLRAIGV